MDLRNKVAIVTGAGGTVGRGNSRQGYYKIINF
jgi:NAD(P)-dependent dehydrogenase (short-subunit alcohol dehydrogenase family)